ncbi:hypothetical protein H634G_04076 [Metarhizium anisopliae BRIP 53293]|uniref:Acyltransferase n=1 Tax=Metarhizium anisopliae BRIP 53293 TaxID=1291518 RepID=A0A0D9P0L4_METAN|nr:hypothetical protein H634G_04076 [Metarhizium anisopliae BRIP 53293]KJK95841.1 hypothetical protein H633G_00190 [Metarhizium anisopliae BRIP 53284]
MEDFIKQPLRAQTFALSAFDMQGSFSNIPYAFFYGNKGQDGKQKEFMPTTLLKQSLAQTLESFPILLGHIKATARCKLQIDLDPSHINCPDFRETILPNNSNVSFATLEAANFSWKSWPEGVATVKPFAMPHDTTGDIKLLNVHVVRLRDNTGLILFVNCPHYVFDGAGYFAFIKEWASNMRCAASQSLPNPGTEYCHDRACIQEYLTARKRPLDPISNAIYATANFLCDAMTWLSPVHLGRLLGKLGSLSPPGQAHLFHITQQTLDSLQKSSQENLPEQVARLSTNDLLVALVGRTYVQSQKQPVPRAGWFSPAPPPETHFSVRIPCDARPRLGMKHNFTGNLLMPVLMRDTMEDYGQETTAASLARSALQVRRCVGDVDAALVSGYHDVLCQHPTSYMRPLAFAASHTTTSMVATSQVRFGLYDADFGFGKPAFVSLTPLFEGTYTMAAFLPPPPGKDGVYILLTTNKDAMAGVVENDFWRQTCELVW